MLDVLWTALFAGIAAAGIVMVVKRRSRAWVAAGVAYFLGGAGFAVTWVITLTGAFDRPAEGSADEVGAWFGGLGFAASFPIIGLAWLARRSRPIHRPDFGLHSNT